MKKILNDPNLIVNDFLEGLLYSRRDLQRVGNHNSLVRANLAINKVALISLGGSGHEPAHAGYIGVGKLDGVACGNVFASPSTEQIYETAKAAHTGAGVLFIVKNYQGDKLNVNMAMRMLKAEGINCEQIIVRDDVTPVEGMGPDGRRGVAGTVILHHILGEASRSYNGLDFLVDLANNVLANLKTMGVGFTPCVIPAVGKPNFSIPDDKVTVGIGIHGEPGCFDREISGAKELVSDLMEYIFKDFGDELKENDRVLLMINGMGSTPLMELYVANMEANRILESRGIKVLKNPVGNFMTSLEMGGFSITVLKLFTEVIPLMRDI